MGAATRSRARATRSRAATRSHAAAAAVLLLLPLAPPAHGDLTATLESPSRVPTFSFISLNNGIAPGDTGTYGFSLLNRYNSSIDNVSITVEIYRYATVEEERTVAQLAAVPTFAAGGLAVAHLAAPTVAPNASVNFTLDIVAPPRALEGVYFTRHTLEFDYGNVTDPPATRPYAEHLVMKSRGYFTDAEWNSINYSDLHASLAALNISGVVPDSSFSVTAPQPLWPVATLVAAAAVSGTLALLYAAVDQRPGKYVRVERALLRLEGKVAVWRALARARLRRGRGGEGASQRKPPKADGSP